VLEGIENKALVFREKMLLSEFHMKKGSPLPLHSYPQEQLGRLLQGRIAISVGSEKLELKPGDCWCVPGNMEHGAEIIEDPIAIEVYSPVREDYWQYYINWVSIAWPGGVTDRMMRVIFLSEMQSSLSK
jgi:quercetin dioxygenase-like cupin family protein